jgi:hypothetical protein
MPSSSKTILDSGEWGKRFIFQRPTAVGNFIEPLITSANIIMETILGAPFRWRWNRAITGFICIPGQQDYTIFNWTLDTDVALGYVLVDSNGNSQVVTTAGETGSTIPTWNTVTGGTTTDGSAVWTNSGSIGISNISQTYAFAWMETISIRTVSSNTCGFEWKTISSKIGLDLDSAQSRPHSISAQGDDGNGNITFRLMPAPDKAYPVAITIQQKPPLLNSVNDFWSPIPDEYGHIYNWGLLSMLFLYADDPRFQLANQKFIAHLLAANQGLTQTEINIFLSQWTAVTGQQQQILPTTNQQGATGRQAL